MGAAVLLCWVIICLQSWEQIAVANIFTLHSEEELPVFTDKHLIQELKELKTEHKYKEEEHVTFDEQPLFISAECVIKCRSLRNLAQS